MHFYLIFQKYKAVQIGVTNKISTIYFDIKDTFALKALIEKNLRKFSLHCQKCFDHLYKYNKRSYGSL